MLRVPSVHPVAPAVLQFNSKTMTNNNLIVGRCPDCGVVIDDEINLRFPHGADCERCGMELEKVTTATEAEIDSIRAAAQ